MCKSELNHSVIEMVPLKICLLNTIAEKPEGGREGGQEEIEGLFIKFMDYAKQSSRMKIYKIPSD